MKEKKLAYTCGLAHSAKVLSTALKHAHEHGMDGEGLVIHHKLGTAPNNPYGYMHTFTFKHPTDQKKVDKAAEAMDRDIRGMRR